jgi:hypothetical protein
MLCFCVSISENLVDTILYRVCQKSWIRSLELGSIHFRVSTTVVSFILSKFVETQRAFKCYYTYITW